MNQGLRILPQNSKSTDYLFRAVASSLRPNSPPLRFCCTNVPVTFRSAHSDVSAKASSTSHAAVFPVCSWEQLDREREAVSRFALHGCRRSQVAASVQNVRIQPSGQGVYSGAAPRGSRVGSLTALPCTLTAWPRHSGTESSLNESLKQHWLAGTVFLNWTIPWNTSTP